MSDIEPWLETGAPPDVAESLRAARAEAPRGAVVERCVAFIGTAGAIGLSTSLAGAAGSGGSAVSALALVKWGLSGLAAGTLVMGGLEVSRRITEPAPKAPAVVVNAPRTLPEPRVVGPSTVSSEPTAVAEPRVEPTVESPPKSSASPSADERLAAELALLNRARAAMDRRDGNEALGLLTDHDRLHGRGAPLAPEARYLRLEALELTGRRAEAAGVAREILARDPRGPHAARARAVLEKE